MSDDLTIEKLLKVKADLDRQFRNIPTKPREEYFRWSEPRIEIPKEPSRPLVSSQFGFKVMTSPHIERGQAIIFSEGVFLGTAEPQAVVLINLATPARWWQKLLLAAAVLTITLLWIL